MLIAARNCKEIDEDRKSLAGGYWGESGVSVLWEAAAQILHL